MSFRNRHKVYNFAETSRASESIGELALPMPNAAEIGCKQQISMVMDFSFSELNYNSVENVPGYEARAAFTVNSATIFREEVDIVPTIVDEKLSYIPWDSYNLLPFKIILFIF